MISVKSLQEKNTQRQFRELSCNDGRKLAETPALFLFKRITSTTVFGSRVLSYLKNNYSQIAIRVILVVDRCYKLLASFVYQESMKNTMVLEQIRSLHKEYSRVGINILSGAEPGSMVPV
jgi:hypothetical protein